MWCVQKKGWQLVTQFFVFQKKGQFNWVNGSVTSDFACWKIEMKISLAYISFISPRGLRQISLAGPNLFTEIICPH